MKVGDIVFKRQWYKEGIYCRYGGKPKEVPLGTEGVIIYIYDDVNRIDVDFSNGHSWTLDRSELMLKNSDIEFVAR
jgi:hypothetical protein